MLIAVSFQDVAFDRINLAISINGCFPDRDEK